MAPAALQADQANAIPAMRSLGDAEGFGNALVGGGGLSVDAVGVDLEQDRDAVPGAAGDLGRGHPGVQPQRDAGVAQVVRAAGERERR
jgi:hypothetical protein